MAVSCCGTPPVRAWKLCWRFCELEAGRQVHACPARRSRRSHNPVCGYAGGRPRDRAARSGHRLRGIAHTHRLPRIVVGGPQERDLPRVGASEAQGEDRRHRRDDRHPRGHRAEAPMNCETCGLEHKTGGDYPLDKISQWEETPIWWTLPPAGAAVKRINTHAFYSLGIKLKVCAGVDEQTVYGDVWFQLDQARDALKAFLDSDLVSIKTCRESGSSLVAAITEAVPLDFTAASSQDKT